MVTFTWKSHNQVNTKIQFCVEDSGQLQYFNSWFMKNLAWAKVYSHTIGESLEKQENKNKLVELKVLIDTMGIKSASLKDKFLF